jgi:outer membrane lipoprotein-sorting protein
MQRSSPFLALVLLLTSPAHAESPGDRAIRLWDEAMRAAKDQSFEYDVITQEPGKEKLRVQKMQVRVKGPSWRRMEWTYPGDVKGMKVLILSLSQMYVYLPEFKKIRRVAGHVRQQSFLGTALSQDDMSITQYGEVYSGRLTGEDDKTWRVEATRRPGKDFPYGKLQLTILKKEHYASEILYFSDKGAKLKSETRTGYSCKGRICNPKELKMTDHTRNGLWTKLVMTDWKINTGIPDSVFTPRDLQRGN